MNEETKTQSTSREQTSNPCSIKNLLDKDTIDELLAAKFTTGG